MASALTSPSVRSKAHLLRILGVGFGIAVIVGGAIGSGVLRTPGLVANQLKTPWIIITVWLAGGIYAFCCTLSIIELGAMLPRAGGWYVFSRRAFGEYAGFFIGCLDWIAQPVAIAYLAVALSDFAVQFPALHDHHKLISVGTVSVLTALNWLGLRAGSRLQELISLVKALGLIAFVVACFLVSPEGASNSSPQINLHPLKGILLAVVVAFQSIIVSYDGWYFAIYFTEEDHDPAKNLAKASLIGVLACIAIHVLMNMALLHVLPLHQLAASDVPAADAAMIIFGTWGKQIVLALAILTIVSSLNATIMLSCRILFGMAREGWLPGNVALVNAGGTPSTALLLVALASIALILSGGYETLIAMASFMVVVMYLSGFCSLFVLRKRELDLPRPFKAWGYPWINLGVLLVSAAFLAAMIIADIKDALFTLILMVVSYPTYLLIRKKKRLASF